MRVIFFGTPEFAVPSLEALLGAGIEVAAVVTQPDRAQGRSHSTLVPPPVKSRGLVANVDVLQPDRPRGDVFLQTLRSLEADLGVVVAYGHLLPTEVLESFPLGMVNVHASILPRWRGAAPIQRALLSGDAETGVAIMRIEEGLDTGAVWLTKRTPIGEDETAGLLTARLSHLGAEALLEAMPRISNGVTPALQATNGVTIAKKIDREVARIRWDESSTAISGRIRAMDPAPGAWSRIDETDVKFYGVHALPSEIRKGAKPGELVEFGDQLAIATGDGAVAVAIVQPAGRRQMSGNEWLRGSKSALTGSFE